MSSLGVFGSYVRGKQRKRSDLDILVEFDERALTLFQFVELRDYLSDLVGRKVDLAEKRALKPAIGRYILEEVIFLRGPGASIPVQILSGDDKEEKDRQEATVRRIKMKGSGPTHRVQVKIQK